MCRTSLWLVLVLWTLQVSGLQAQEPGQITPSSVSTLSSTPLRPSSEQDLSAQSARDWGLTREEWVRYKQLMRGPLGIYSPTLDPLTALGTEARTDSERRHIAEVQVRMEAQRVEKLLAYQRAYDAAWKRIYPALPPFLEPAQRPPNTPLSAAFQTGATPMPGASPMPRAAPARLAVFVKEDCPVCDQRVKDLEGSGQAFDLYMIGTRGDDARIRAWATRLKIDPAKVRAGIITLNHDGGRWFSIGLPGSVPAVLHSVNGQWLRE
ncbi:MAG: TIGR03759 family integrating conjugative element protein [Proteobacteria bacterium]|nr:TIGR03759 family integrating conjugative element protein [Pseudomonadota bacterium]